MHRDEDKLPDDRIDRPVARVPAVRSEKRNRDGASPLVARNLIYLIIVTSIFQAHHGLVDFSVVDDRSEPK